jgi:hypothetical protein
MTENQKKIAIVAGVIIIALILLMSRKQIAQTQATNPLGDVQLPSQSLPARNINVVIPGLPNYSPYQYSPISPCMCNGAAVTQSAYQGPLVTFVTNQASNGPNIFNYPSPTGGGNIPLTGVPTG